MTKPPEKYFSIARGLSLAGGGIRGLFAAAALRELENKSGRTINDCFDVVAGTSAGGIIAIALVADVPISKISELFYSKAHEIFGSPAKLNPWRARTASHKPINLEGAIREVLREKGNMRVREIEGKNIVVSSVNIETNEIVYFSNVDRIGSIQCEDASLIDIAMATSAAPTYFPPRNINGVAYVDGGIVSNSPDLEALHFMMKHEMKTADQVQLLSIGTGNTFYSFDKSDAVRHGSYDWITKHQLIDRIISLQESKASEIASDILKNRYLRIDAHFDYEIKLDETNAERLTRLAERGTQAAKAAWEAHPSHAASFLR